MRFLVEFLIFVVALLMLLFTRLVADLAVLEIALLIFLVVLLTFLLIIRLELDLVKDFELFVEIFEFLLINELILFEIALFMFLVVFLTFLLKLWFFVEILEFLLINDFDAFDIALPIFLLLIFLTFVRVPLELALLKAPSTILLELLWFLVEIFIFLLLLLLFAICALILLVVCLIFLFKLRLSFSNLEFLLMDDLVVFEIALLIFLFLIVLTFVVFLSLALARNKASSTTLLEVLWFFVETLDFLLINDLVVFEIALPIFLVVVTSPLLKRLPEFLIIPLALLKAPSTLLLDVLIPVIDLRTSVLEIFEFLLINELVVFEIALPTFLTPLTTLEAADFTVFETALEAVLIAFLVDLKELAARLAMFFVVLEIILDAFDTPLTTL